eukprot:2404466-Rhodomonas_salina.3
MQCPHRTMKGRGPATTIVVGSRAVVLECRKRCEEAPVRLSLSTGHGVASALHPTAHHQYCTVPRQ